MKALMALAAAAILGMGCGSTDTCACGAGLAPSDHVTATEKDKAVSMRVGQTLEVVLHGGGQITWQQVKSSDTSLLEPAVDPAATAARGVTLAAFKARAAGETQVTAVGAPVCPSGQPCPMFAVLYSLTVTITP